MPRTPYCTGCGVLFPKKHLMINHRRQERCGGRFLPADEHVELLAAKNIRQFMALEVHPLHIAPYVELLEDHLIKATLLRTSRLQRVV